MKQDIVIYHGSQQIVEVPQFGVGKNIMTTDRAFTVLRTASLQKSGRALLKMMAIQANIICPLPG